MVYGTTTRIMDGKSGERLMRAGAADCVAYGHIHLSRLFINAAQLTVHSSDVSKE